MNIETIQLLTNIREASQEAARQAEAAQSSEHVEVLNKAREVERRADKILQGQLALPPDSVESLRQAESRIRIAVAPPKTREFKVRVATAILSALQLALAVLPGDDTTPPY